MITHTTRENREQRTREPGTADRQTARDKQDTAHGRRRTSRRRDGRQLDTGVAPTLAPWSQPVPIVEVGTGCRDGSGKAGIIRDVMDQAGMLVYLVEFAGSEQQCIPARALKGVQI